MVDNAKTEAVNMDIKTMDIQENHTNTNNSRPPSGSQMKSRRVESKNLSYDFERGSSLRG